VVARRHLVDRGLTPRAIDRRVEARRLHPIHRGVYAVGHRRLPPLGHVIAAVLACGPDAVASHSAAAALWGVRDALPSVIDVTAPRTLAGRRGIRVHRADLPPDERTTEAGIPTTTPARTLLDLAATSDRHELARALERAEAQRLSDGIPLRALLDRHRGNRGVARLKAALQDGAATPRLTRSELERRFLTFLEESGLPLPQTNVWLQAGDDWIQVDCLWPDRRLVVELDGRAHHHTAAAFERDRRRDRDLVAAGLRVIRVTERARRSEPRALRAQLEGALAR